MSGICLNKKGVSEVASDQSSRAYRNCFVIFFRIEGREGGKRMKRMIGAVGKRPCWFLGSGDGKHLLNLYISLISVARRKLV